MKVRNTLIIVSIIICITIAIWTIQIMNGQVPLIDKWTRDLALSIGETPLYTFALLVTNLGSKHFLIPFGGVAAVFIAVLYRHWFPPVLFISGTLITYELNGMIKEIIERERPTISLEANAVGNSFPSGHAMISMVFYGLLGYLIARKIKHSSLSYVSQVIFSFFIFIIGISRFLLNVHYLTDIVAGFMIGFIFLIGFIYLIEIYYFKKVINNS